MRPSPLLLAACSLLCGCLSFPDDEAYRCDGAPAPGCSDQCFCPEAQTSINDRINFMFGGRYGQDVWVVGLNGPLWRLRNGAWSPQGNLGQQLYGGWGREPDGILVVGAGGLLLESDGDGPLIPVSTGTSAALTAAWSMGPDEAWAIGVGGVMFHRTAAGWSAFTPSPTTVTFNAMHGNSPGNVWAVGDGGKAFQWDGDSWTERSPPLTGELQAVWVSGEGDVWVAGQGGASARLHDGAWSVIGGAAVDLVALSGATPDDVWAGGAAGAVFHFQGGTWVRAHNLSTESAATYGVWEPTAGDLWVGSGTTVEHRHP
ncbi:MAG TPA: hypothetical protein VND93_25360 [Myxococcales bacterium]|nr:hypothetical protein [Myxococcales bacterium]